MTRIGIILGSTRPNRNGEQVAKWVYDLASRRTQVDVKVEVEAHAQQDAVEVLGVADAGIADRAEEDGVGFLEVGPDGGGDWLVRAEVLVRIDVVFLEVEVGACGAQDFDRFGYDFFACPVTRQDRDVIRHLYFRILSWGREGL